MAKEVIIKPADEIEVIANSLIREFHPELTECCLLYYVTTAPTKCSPQKCNPVVRYGYSRHLRGVEKAEVASGPDFIVWVNDLLWEFQVTRGKQRPFVDHLLEHIAKEVDGEGISRFVLKPHSLEEHAEVLQRFGPWSDEAKQVRDILQRELDLGESEETRMTLRVPGYAPITASMDELQRATAAIKRGE